MEVEQTPSGSGLSYAYVASGSSTNSGSANQAVCNMADRKKLFMGELHQIVNNQVAQSIYDVVPN